jgi:asparagine synthase (glutamine-hydrolysing)
MCGLAGLFVPKDGSAAKPDLARMTAVLKHRGPDGTGRFTADDGRYQAVFTRLAIIDLATGDQPLIAADGGRVLMGNGEIYNYVELRRDFADYPYRTSGDMEAVLAVERRHGDDFVHHLNGIYGLALYRADSHELVLVRDRLGVKPIYWARVAGGGILFASEIKALFASGLIRPAVDEDAVSSYLAHGYVPAPATLFAGVYKLQPGHVLKATAAGEVAVDRYWQPQAASDLPRDAGGIAAHLTELLSDSVRLQLRSDVPVGALLSGGIDSGLVVALAAGATDRPLNTYTVRFEGAAVDETPLAGAVAERYATNHTVLDLPARDVGAHLPKLAWYCDEPINDPALLPNFLIEEALGRHLKVALNGTGGDELFAGYGRYFQMPVEARYLTLPRWLRRGLIEPGLAPVSAMTAWRLARAEKFGANRGAYLHDHTTQFPAPMRARIGNALPPPDPAQARLFAAFSGPPQSAALAADLETYLVEDLLTLLDRTSMAVGVEGRVPLLDHRLVAAALAVPPEIRTPGGQQKGLERKIAEPFLPAESLAAPKQGFASPVPAWLEAGLAPLARRILTAERALERGWWSKDGIEHLLSNPAQHGFRVYTLLMLELAVRIHVEAPAADAPLSDGLEAFADAA